MRGLPEFVSLNGPDNCGKTTQLKLLAEHEPRLQALGSVHHHGPEPWHAVARLGQDSYSSWWFRQSSTRLLTGMLVDSHSKRAAARRAGRIGLLDRGLPMLMAAAAATCCLKDQLGVDAALDTVTGIASEVFPQAPEEASVLLMPSWDTCRSYAITSARDRDDWTGIYSDYQHALHRVLLAQAERDCYSAVIDCENRSVHEVHEQVLTHTVLP